MNGYKKFGVQSSYTMPNRKRYNAGKYVTKKYGSRKAYTRRVNVRRNLKSGETSFKIQDQLFVYSRLTTSSCYAYGNTYNYTNIHSIISASLDWTNIVANYSLFRLNGILIKVARVFNESLSAGGGATTISPSLYVNYYPTVTSTEYTGVQVSSADSSLRVDPYVTGFQSKYISIPKNFSNLTTGIGIGTWNPVVSIANLPGEIVVAGNINSTSGMAVAPAFEMLVTFYISACNDKP